MRTTASYKTRCPRTSLVYLQNAPGLLRTHHRKRFDDTLISDENGLILPACNNTDPIVEAIGFMLRWEVGATRKIVR
jgi:hypothetical protein